MEEHVLAFPDDERSRQVIAEAREALVRAEEYQVLGDSTDTSYELERLLALIELDGEEKK